MFNTNLSSYIASCFLCFKQKDQMSIKMIETENIVDVHLKLPMQVAMQKKENTASHILLASI